MLEMTSSAPSGWLRVPPSRARGYQLSDVGLKALLHLRLGMKLFYEDRIGKPIRHQGLFIIFEELL